MKFKSGTNKSPWAIPWYRFVQNPLKIKTIKNLKIKNCFSGAMILRSRFEEYSWNIERDLQRRKRQELFPKAYETFYGAYVEKYKSWSDHAKG